MPCLTTATPLARCATSCGRPSPRGGSGAFILGPEVEAFERELAAYVGAGQAVGVGNGTDALTIALRAMGVGPGDEVVVPSFTFYASAEAIPPTGARPVFCDMDPETFCVTADTVRAALTPQDPGGDRRAPVRQRRPRGRDRGARGTGARGRRPGAGLRARARAPGSLGRAATFSFFPSKNLGGLATAGRSPPLTPSWPLACAACASTARGTRRPSTRSATTLAWTRIQAAILRVQLPHLDGWADGRRAAAAHYERAGLGELVSLPDGG